jgi:hypothetical protein
MTIRFLTPCTTLMLVASVSLAFAQANEPRERGEPGRRPEMRAPAARGPAGAERRPERVERRDEPGQRAPERRLGGPGPRDEEPGRPQRVERAPRADEPIRRRADERGPNAPDAGAPNAGAPDRRAQDRPDRDRADQDRPDRDRADRDRPDRVDRDRDRADRLAPRAGRARIEIEPADRARISQRISREKIDNLRNVDFTVRAGGIVPPRYEFRPLPPEIVEILPDYHGYDYLVVNNEILVIEPGTRRIVDLIPEETGDAMRHRATDCR